MKVIKQGNSFHRPFNPWTCSKPQSILGNLLPSTCCWSWPSFEQVVELDVLQSCLSTLTMLWVSESIRFNRTRSLKFFQKERKKNKISHSLLFPCSLFWKVNIYISTHPTWLTSLNEMNAYDIPTFDFTYPTDLGTSPFFFFFFFFFLAHFYFFFSVDNFSSDFSCCKFQFYRNNFSPQNIQNKQNWSTSVPITPASPFSSENLWEI